MSDNLDELITKHVQLWLKWIEYDNTSKNPSIDMSTRIYAARMCEDLVYEKYRSIALMDAYFDKIIKEKI